MRPGYDTILTPAALNFVVDLCRKFRPRVETILAQRAADQARYDAGENPGFCPCSRDIREGEWTCDPIPAALQDRRVEITGPVVPTKMVINALNSGAKIFMADFEDSLAPTWANLMDGQINLKAAVNRTIQEADPTRNRMYKLKSPAETAVLLVRPRGWHLPEAHLMVDGKPCPGSLFDFGLYFFHNHAVFRASHGWTGPYFYLPKMEHSREAQLWDDVFVYSQEQLGVPVGSIKVTMLIETLPAVFQMNEMLHALRRHAVGLNCGRWDYIFSFIKTFRARPDKILPDRAQVTMTMPFLNKYVQLLIYTCHRRGVHAMGGMAAQIPIKDDAEKNNAAMAKVRADKLREVKNGHDGTWVAHPGLVPLALEVFNAHMPGANLIHVKREDAKDTTAAELTEAPTGAISVDGLRTNVSVGVHYMAAWIGGLGCVPIHNLMEDAATAEISRVQMWQWLRFGVEMDAGNGTKVKVTPELIRRVMGEEMAKLRKAVGEAAWGTGNFEKAARLFERQVFAKELDTFLTLGAYEFIRERLSRL
eukprot:jgi/Mesvir1/15440/Mv06623-RA.1